MSATVTVAGCDPVLVTPTGCKALSMMLARQRGARPDAPIGAVHAATRDRLVGQGLVEVADQKLRLSNYGYLVAVELEAAS